MHFGCHMHDIMEARLFMLGPFTKVSQEIIGTNIGGCRVHVKTTLDQCPTHCLGFGCTLITYCAIYGGKLHPIHANFDVKIYCKLPSRMSQTRKLSIDIKLWIRWIILSFAYDLVHTSLEPWQSS